MSILYANITKPVLLRANQLKDAASASARNTIYEGNLGDLADGMEVPLAALKQSVLASEKRISDLVGRSKNPVLRGSLYAVSANISSGAILPNAPTGGDGEWVGNFSGFIDSATSRPLTEKTKQEIFRFNENAGNFYKLPAFHFCLEGSRLFHTRSNAKAEGCAWNYTAQSTAYDNTNIGTSPLHGSLEQMWIADVLANLAQEDWFAGEAQMYSQMAARGEQMILAGIVPQTVLPDSTANENPIKN